MSYRMRRDENGKRRRVHEFDGVEGYFDTFTHECMGCTEYAEGYYVSGPHGCDGCGYTGRRRERIWTPFDTSEDPRLKPHREESTMADRSVTGCWMCGSDAARDLLCEGCVREVEPELLDAALDVATDDLIEALINAPDGAEEAALRAQLEEILAGFGIRREGT